jgi:glyceraldehyde 3-phosphate dehydrogenase
MSSPTNTTTKLPPPTKIGINGFGRMGRLSARIIIREMINNPNQLLELVHINEKIGGSDMAAYLLEFDSTHGKLEYQCESIINNTKQQNDEYIQVTNNNNKLLIKYTTYSKPEEIPWHELGVEIVFDCTGAFLTPNKLQGHFHSKTVKRILVSAPVDEGNVLNVVVGCNEHLIQPDMKIITAASCTTNCAAPVIGVIDQHFGIELGSISTVHNVTPTQSIMDVPTLGKKGKADLRRARSGAVNLAPTTTGSAKAVAMIYPHLKGKLDGLAIRVPQQNASITDLVLLVKRDVTKEQVNQVLLEYCKLHPIVMGYETRQLVSTDYINDPRSSIIDAHSTQVIGKRLIKILSWYDNEWGYVNRMIDIAKIMVVGGQKQQLSKL